LGRDYLSAPKAQRRRRDITEPTLKASASEPRRVGKVKGIEPQRGGTCTYPANWDASETANSVGASLVA